jgi:hypothetical protein
VLDYDDRKNITERLVRAGRASRRQTAEAAAFKQAPKEKQSQGELGL